MDMEDSLPPIGAGIHHHPVPTLIDSLFPSQPLGSQEEFPHHLPVTVFEFGNGGNVLPGDDENVAGSLRADIPERHHSRGFVQEFRGNVP
jgi:hypothetical protein